jgi:hypothetical protein
MNMAKSVLENLVKENNVKYVSLKVKIPENLKEMITSICKEYGVKEDEYLGKLLENSEIQNIFNKLNKDKQVNKKIEEKHE